MSVVKSIRSVTLGGFAARRRAMKPPEFWRNQRMAPQPKGRHLCAQCVNLLAKGDG